MSGIAGTFNFDCAPVSPQLLRRMAESMAFRGPDKQVTWVDGGAGLVHTMLRTTDESFRERQPFSLDSRIWIVADARVDGGDDLVRRLETAGRGYLKNATDVELILHAYYAWGEDCVSHLIGDFAFAIWDKRERSLFCARDHFGVKPFYYARAGNSLIVSNTLSCIRLHPGVSDRLNDQAVGDFLIWDTNESQETTFFADVQKLPAAHTLSWSNGGLRIRRYWTMPIEDEIRRRRETDYVERFVELLDHAVNDRLRTDRVGVFMSGGMDSPTVAATANKLLSRKSAPFDLRAYTIVYDRLIPDEERLYSGLVAEHIGIPINYTVVDDYPLYGGFDEPEFHRPEPVNIPSTSMWLDQYRQIARHTRVTLTGQGGDVVLRGSFSYLINLFKSLRFGRAALEVGRHVLTHGGLPQIGFRTRIRRWLKRSAWKPPYPDWLNRDFEARLSLPERWNQLLTEAPHIHPRRPEAYQFLTATFWTKMFENYDPEVSGVPIETRHPLFDLRLLRYTLALPTLPVCVDKRLMRLAMRGLLPERTLRRPKAPLAGDPTPDRLRDCAGRLWQSFVPVEALSQYVDLSKYANRDFGVASERPRKLDSELATLEMRPISLNRWLKGIGSP
ncbi:MAG TPA: asparagine synthase-related protein [Blastocatellia bacterium]|nr:asparagine synthase-related protein [Blastocatellia bacterium]